MQATETKSKQMNLDLNSESFGLNFDKHPFGFKHHLSEQDMFSAHSLAGLAECYGKIEQDYFLAASANNASDIFENVRQYKSKPGEFFQQLGPSKGRMLLKRPEKYSDAFAELLKSLHQQVMDLIPNSHQDPVVRLESAIFVSSAKTVTPAHWDPEIGFFCQIRGEKFYHVYDPSVVSERELEDFYKLNDIRTCQVDLPKLNTAKEHVFHLREGDGFHQPQNSPHWVETGDDQSVSYTMVFETASGRTFNRTRAFNYYQRRLGLNPSLPGIWPKLDMLKSEAMKSCFPIKSAIGRTLKAVHMR